MGGQTGAHCAGRREEAASMASSAAQIRGVIWMYGSGREHQQCNTARTCSAPSVRFIRHSRCSRLHDFKLQLLLQLLQLQLGVAVASCEANGHTIMLSALEFRRVTCTCHYTPVDPAVVDLQLLTLPHARARPGPASAPNQRSLPVINLELGEDLSRPDPRLAWLGMNRQLLAACWGCG